MGSESSPSAPVCATARTLFQSTPRSTKSSLNVDRQVFVGRPRRLPLPRGVHDMAWLACRPGGILIIWPAIRCRLSATMSCNLRCPVRLSTSIFVTWSFHVMPKILRYLPSDILSWKFQGIMLWSPVVTYKYKTSYECDNGCILFWIPR